MNSSSISPLLSCCCAGWWGGVCVCGEVREKYACKTCQVHCVADVLHNHHALVAIVVIINDQCMHKRQVPPRSMVPVASPSHARTSWRPQRPTLMSLLPTAMPISARSLSREDIISVTLFFWWLVISFSFCSSESMEARMLWRRETQGEGRGEEEVQERPSSLGEAL